MIFGSHKLGIFTNVSAKLQLIRQFRVRDMANLMGELKNDASQGGDKNRLTTV